MLIKVTTFRYVTVFVILLACILETSLIALAADQWIANGGQYWSTVGSGFNTAAGGYCTVQAQCNGGPPGNFVWKASTTGTTNYAVWENPDTNANTTVHAYIPSTHATNNARYEINYLGGSQANCYINQNSYFNQMAVCGGTWYNVRYVLLTNYQGTSGYSETAWDEIWLHY